MKTAEERFSELVQAFDLDESMGDTPLFRDFVAAGVRTLKAYALDYRKNGIAEAVSEHGPTDRDAFLALKQAIVSAPLPGESGE